jgi:TolB-like protein/DNA-binding winged helix-turn-helix (wHTH) protein/Tfp pilus assembly protein PilF
MSEHEKNTTDSSVCFGSCQLDVRQVQVWRDHHEVKLTGKAFAVLCYFVDHPGQLVTKDDLFAAAWPETVVSDATLASCIQEVRQALGDDAKQPRYIETVHRRGFRFLPAVTTPPVVSDQLSVVSSQEEEANQKANGKTQKSKVAETETDPEKSEDRDAGRRTPPAPSVGGDAGLLAQSSVLSPQLSLTPRRWRWWQLLLLMVLLILGGGLAANWRLVRLVIASYVPPPVQEPIALPLPDKPSLVVLPLVNLSGDVSQEYFSDGLTDDLINTLAQFPDLFVIARQSAFTYKGKAIKEQDVGRELGVRYVLTGSVRRADGQVRMNVQLVDTTTGEQVWTERYDRPFTAIFALQDDLVQKLGTTLKLQFSLLKQGGSIRKTTDNVEAYDYMLRGMAHWLRTSKEDNLRAQEFYEKALTLDPQYAAAYTEMGITYYMEWIMQWSSDPQNLERALEYGQKAVAVNELYPGGHNLLALAYARKGQTDRALSEIERVITRLPGYANGYLEQAEVLLLVGRPQEALRSIQHAMRLNPHGHVIQFAMLGVAYHFTEHYAESIVAFKRALALTPFYPAAYPIQAFNYVAQWMTQQSHDTKILDKAYDTAQNGLTLNDAFPLGRTALGHVYLWQKQYEQAIVEFDRAVALDENYVCGQMMLAYGLSQVGRVQEAVQVGERALRLKALPSDDRCLYGVASAYALAGRREEAVALYLRMLQQFPNSLGFHLQLADIYSQLGRETEAQAAATEVLRLNPQFSLEVHKERVPLKDPAMLERHIAALRKAGLK